MRQLLIGDIVTLISGGPDMTIVDIHYGGEVTVAWFDESGLGNARLLPTALYVKDKPAPVPNEPIRDKISKIVRRDQ